MSVPANSTLLTAGDSQSNCSSGRQDQELLIKLDTDSGSQDDKTKEQRSDDTSSLEQSFEVITKQAVGNTPISDASADYSTPDYHSSREHKNPSQVVESNVENKPRSNSEQSNEKKQPEANKLSSSIQNRLRNSGSFIAKQLQSSSSNSSRNHQTIIATISADHDEDVSGLPSSHQTNNSNIPSSIVSAFSSFSTSLTSNFSRIHNNNSGTSNYNHGKRISGSKSGSLQIETDSNVTRLSLISETREDIFTKKAAQERKNLISLTRLITKDLISSSLKVNRTYDDLKNSVHLTNYFTLIDRVLKHGLKPSLLSHKYAGLWNALDGLQKHMKESTLIGESIRSLTYTRTPDGKIKAWMRLAMMQKKLPEYFSELLAHKEELLRDIYHDLAFMLNDEAPVFAGLIIGVNVIDCNFFVKDANFDLMDDIIDLSPYLRVANNYDADDSELDSELDTAQQHLTTGYNTSSVQLLHEGLDNRTSPTTTHNNSMKAILDQKNYLEEFNRRLESTISDLQLKIKHITNENSKLEMEAKLSEAKIRRLEGKSITSQPYQQPDGVSSSITGAIKSLMGGAADATNQQTCPPVTDLAVAAEASVESELSSGLIESQNAIEQQQATSDRESAEADRVANQVEREKLQARILELEKELAALKERTGILETSYRSSLEKIKGLERDLDVQSSINADKESTIKIYEKDIKEKQSQVEHLRVSLNDAKKLNSDLSERLESTGTKLKERLKMVSNLQAGLDKWKLENKTLASRLQSIVGELDQCRSELATTKQTVDGLRASNASLGEELRNERANGQTSSVTLDSQNAKIGDLTNRLQQLELERKSLKGFKDKSIDYEQKLKELEQSLEEMGVQLRESRLETDNLRENSAVFLDSQWVDSKLVKDCAICKQLFSVTRRKHHCRLCGNVFCQTCSDNKMELASSARPVRVCDVCHSFLLAKFVKSTNLSSSSSSAASSIAPK